MIQVQIGNVGAMAHRSQIRPYRKVVWQYPNLIVTVKTPADTRCEPDSTSTGDVFDQRVETNNEEEVRPSKEGRKRKHDTVTVVERSE